MSEVEDSWEYDSEISDLYQDRLTQGTLSGGRQIKAKTCLHGAKRGKDKGISNGSECSEDDETTLS